MMNDVQDTADSKISPLCTAMKTVQDTEGDLEYRQDASLHKLKRAAMKIVQDTDADLEDRRDVSTS